jgi:hypothetical protein
MHPEYFGIHNIHGIKAKKGKRTSPYLETELWERDDLLLVVKYELFKGEGTLA